MAKRVRRVIRQRVWCGVQGAVLHARRHMLRAKWCAVCVCVAFVLYVVSWCGCVGVWGEQVQEDLHWQVAVAHAAHPARHHGRVRHHDVPRPWQRRGPVLPHPLRLIVFVHDLCSFSRPTAPSIRSEGGVRGEGESVRLGWGGLVGLGFYGGGGAQRV
jgi:hypothetical protein